MPKQIYNHTEVEAKWRQKWQDSNLYHSPEIKTGDKKKFILETFPYPSGVAMHVGHAEGYIASDITARFARLQGYKVLYPMGWDAFGLPAENYAIKTGIHPRPNTDKIIEISKEQLTRIGLSYNWDREIATHRPEYYRWTQWLFGLFYKNGLAYKKKALVNWDPVDQTVLANEQVLADGTAERSGAKVEQKMLEQWFFRITDYIEDKVLPDGRVRKGLLSGLDDVDWPESTKTMQRHWIGRSEGAEVDFQVVDSTDKVTVFTTRIDTLFSGTFLLLAPEHPLVASLTTEENIISVAEYLEITKSKSNLERTDLNKNWTGCFTGSYAINPATGDIMPIWITDFVLADYGTGAVFADAHDERDFFLAKKYNIPLKTSLEPVTGTPQTNPEFRRSVVALVRDPQTNQVLSINWGSNGGNLFIGGGVEEGEDLIEAAKREITEETGYTNLKFISQTDNIHHQYFAHSKNQARHILATGLYFELIDDKRVEQKLESDEQGKFTLEWLTKAQAESQIKDELHRHIFDTLILDKPYTGFGILYNSDQFDGLTSQAAKPAITTWGQEHGWARSKITYRLRDWSIGRQRFWGPPIPIVYTIEVDPIIENEMSFGKEAPNEEFKHGCMMVVFDPTTQKYAYYQNLSDSKIGLAGGGQEVSETDEQTARREVAEELGLSDMRSIHKLGAKFNVHYYHPGKKLNRVATAQPFLVILNSDQTSGLARESHEKFATKWGQADEIINQLTQDSTEETTRLHYAEAMKRGTSLAIALDLDKISDSSKYTLFSKKETLVDDSDLPVILPDNVDFHPTGRSPLVEHQEFHSSAEAKYGAGARREVDTLDTFVDSSWYFFRYCSPQNDQAFSDKEQMKLWMPVDQYIIGAEHSVLHLLYSRFFTKVLFDLGYIDFDEPFKLLRHQGMILAEDSRKMSKRWGNVVNPSDICDEYGADTLRLYEMFMGPFEQAKPWNTNTVKGVRRFLDRVWKAQDLVNKEEFAHYAKLETALNKMIKKVEEDIPDMSFNTAVAEFMKFLNALDEVGSISASQYHRFLITLAPFAPYITEELYEILEFPSKKDSIHLESWPEYDPASLVEDTVTMVVQINGKVRAQFTIDTDSDEAIVTEQAKVAAAKWLEGQTIKFIKVVPNKLVSIVIG